MTLPLIEFTKTQGGINRPLANEDHISGMIFIQASKPSGYGTDDIKQILDVPSAETLGIAEGSATTGIMHYHISEFFRINPGATLYVGVYTALSESTQLNLMQNFADGKIRQIGIWTDAALTTTIVGNLQTAASALESENKPLIVGISPNIATVTDLATLPDLRALGKNNVFVSIGQDGAAYGNTFFIDPLGINSLKSIGVIGALLGAISKASVHECIGWVAKFNMVGDGVELDVPALGNGTLIKNLTTAQLEALNTSGYIFLKKHVGIAGSYFNDSHNCSLITSDYNRIELVRTIDKAIRNIRTYMLPELNRPIYVDPVSGKLTPDMVTYLEDKGGQALAEMERAGELSGYKVVINPDQNIITSSEIEISIVNIPVGVARTIKFNIGYVTKLS